MSVGPVLHAGNDRSPHLKCVCDTKYVILQVYLILKLPAGRWKSFGLGSVVSGVKRVRSAVGILRGRSAF